MKFYLGNPIANFSYSFLLSNKLTDKDSLLEQVLVKFLYLLFGPFVYILVKLSFSKNPGKSI